MIKKILRKITVKLNSPVLALIDKSEYQKQIERAYKAGYNYHQKLVANDPELLTWIVRKHYFDDFQY